MLKVDYETADQRILTPSYVFDTDVVNARIAMIKKLLGERVSLCYAMKANAFIIDAMQDHIDRYEVCSPGEFRICERAGIPMEKIVMSGVYKAEEDIHRVIKTYGTEIVYTAESQRQFEQIDAAAQEAGIEVRVLLRVTSGNQFGIDEPLLREIIAHRRQYAGVKIIGIQHFSGTQRKRLSKYEEELHYVDELLADLKQQYGYEAEELEFGPGFYVEYFQGAKAYDEQELLKGFRKLLDDLQFQGNITLELGRFIAASCGKYYTRIVDMKQNSGVHYCIVDGGIHQLNYFGQMMAMKQPYYRQLSETNRERDTKTYNICGSLCTVNDNLVKNMELQDAQINDILEFSNTGAYSMIEGASLFLSRDLPRIYRYSDSDGLQLLRDRFDTDVLNYKMK